MPTAIVIDSVTTEDAHPNAAPHRVSPDPGHDDWSYQATATHDGQIVPSYDLVPSAGAIYPDEGWCPDDPLMVPDRGAIIPGVPRDIVGWIVREGGVSPATGRLIEQVTNRCSDNCVCSDDPAKSTVRDPAREPRLASGSHISNPHTFADVNDGGADGARDINVYVLTENQGWT